MKNIKFNEPFITGNELKYIEDVFRENHFYGVGKYSKLCTAFLEDRYNVNKVLLTDSCTSALEISALLLRDVTKEQEIILPSYTFSSTASAFARAGFNLVFAEINSEDMMLNIKDVEDKITEKTTAIVVVHYGGYCADVLELKELCNKHNIKLVEDAAQAIDCYIDNKALGTIGDFGCFSFHETKNIHAGLSGALLINDNSYNDRATNIWERGTNRQEVLKGLVDKYSWVEVGGSFYPTELQAAFLYAQLESIDRNTNERKIVFNEYDTLLRDLKLSGKLNYPSFKNTFKSNYHAFYIILNSENECDDLRIRLVEHGISAYIGYVPLHSSKVGLAMGNKPLDLPITESLSKCILRLPLHNHMTIADVHRVTSIVKDVLNEK